MPDIIKIEGLDRLEKVLDNLENLRIFRRALRQSAVYVLEELRTYPPQRRLTRKSVYGKTFQSDKQRRWFFAALRSGEIQVPYRRTNAFRKNWTIKSGRSGLRQVVENFTGYGPYNMGNRSQSRFQAKIGWRKTQTVVKEVTPRLERDLALSIEKEMGG
jgi:hypothetical protein